MIVLRKLAPSEAVQAFPRRGSQIDLTDYLDAIQSLNIGETAEIEMDGLTRRAVKRRMGMAAKQLGVTIKWSRMSDDEFMIFQLRDTNTPKRTIARRAKRNGRAREARPSREAVAAY